MHEYENTKNTLAERLVDSQFDDFSFRDIITKVFLRPKLFLFALLMPPIIAVLMASLVKDDWVASTKILIRYSASDSGLLSGLVSDSRLGLSGATSAELIKSAPVLERTIREVGIVDQDIYTSPNDVIRGTISGFISAIFGKHHQEANQLESGPSSAELVNKFKNSLESSSKKSSSSKSIEILEKTSQVPDSMKLDELITLEVKSFNREKVADMANGLANAFINEYYLLYAEDAKKQLTYLDNLVMQEQEQLKRIEQASPADFVNDNPQSNNSGRELISREVPILSSMANQLLATEGELARASQIYAANAPQVTRLRNQVNNLKFMLKKQERIEISKQLLEQLKAKRYQAINTESVYKDKLVPISIAELAVEPKNSGSRKLTRLITSGVIGIILGSMLAITLMIILNVIDPRLHLKKDVEKLTKKPIISYIPKLKKFKLSDYKTLDDDKSIEQGIWQLIAKVGQKTKTDQAKTIVISTPAKGGGASFCSLTLARSLAKNKKNSVCLIDASFNDASVSNLLDLEGKSGLIDAMIDGNLNEKIHEQSKNLFIIGTGKLSRRSELGYYADSAKAILDELAKQFDYIIIDSGTALKNNETLVFGSLANETILVVSAGISRKGMLQAAITKLEHEGLKITGLIFNQSKEVLPAFIYRML